ncbi:stressosome-associated protein Prli42 [Siminovitchia terrae]|nr:stressosome-associated protein Prli42 [Siminovitchia terrae]
MKETRSENILSNKKVQRLIIYLMLFAMIATTVMAGLSFLL